MNETRNLAAAPGTAARPWDARLAAWLVAPLRDSWVTPNHLTSLRLLVGLLGAGCLARGSYLWSNLGALGIVLSNFIDHTDGELARLSGKSSRIGHLYDLASDAVITVLLFACLGLGNAAVSRAPSQALLGWIAGLAVALIFYTRMRLEERLGKGQSRQASLAGFETEDVLYLLPLVTVFDVNQSFIWAAAIGAPLFLVFVLYDYWRKIPRSRA